MYDNVENTNKALSLLYYYKNEVVSIYLSGGHWIMQTLLNRFKVNNIRYNADFVYSG